MRSSSAPSKSVVAGLRPDTSPTQRTLAVQNFFDMLNGAMELWHLRYFVAPAIVWLLLAESTYEFDITPGRISLRPYHLPASLGKLPLAVYLH